MPPVREFLHQLEVHDLVPDRPHAIFLGGSYARGWNHANSDVDLFVVVRQLWESSTSVRCPVSLRPEMITTESVLVDEVRWEVRYWLDEQVDQVFAKVSDKEFRRGNAWRSLTTPESILLERIGSGMTVDGDHWMADRRRQLKDSAFPAILVAEALLQADANMEDALGLLEVGEVDTAVASARLALGNVADAVAASHGELGREEKWRARRIKLVASPLLSFERYWHLETMRAFDPGDARSWVMEVNSLYQAVARELAL